MRIQKPDKLLGYVLLIIGLIILFIPVIMGILILVGNMEIPQFIKKPTISGTDGTVELAKAIADAFPVLNIIPLFLLFVALISAGSVLMGKGIGLIKEISWKVVKAGKEETEEAAEPEAKPPKKARTEKQEPSE